MSSSQEHLLASTGSLPTLADDNATVDDGISVMTPSTEADSTNSSTSNRRESTTSVIKPRTSSLRMSLDRAKNDLSMAQLRFSDDHLYGRETESQILTSSFTKAYNQELDRQLLLLAGEAGTGKSALSVQLVPQVRRRGGFCMGGKFDQQQQHQHSDSAGTPNEPYGVFTEACSDLVDGLLALQAEEQPTTTTSLRGMRSSFTSGQLRHSTSPSVASLGRYTCSNKWSFTFQEFQDKLQKELGGNDDHGDNNLLEVLTTVFPYLTQIVGGNFLTANYNTSAEMRVEESKADNDDKDDNDRDNFGNNQTYSHEIMGYNEAKNKFNFAFLQLMRVVCSFGPAVLFLDDLHWGDKASLDLLEALMKDCITSSDSNNNNNNNNKNNRGYGLMVVATYRSEQVDEHHPLSHMVSKLAGLVEENPDISFRTKTLAIGNLTMEQVNHLLYDVLSATDREMTLSLAECIHRKTGGNAFYVVQFLKSLATEVEIGEDGKKKAPLLTFNMGTFKWSWNVEEIKLREAATSNVVEMLHKKMESLPKSVLSLLPLVACLGSNFEYSMLKRVLEHFGNELVDREPARKSLLKANNDDNSASLMTFDVEGYVAICEREGLLEFDKKRKIVQFCHDKIQEAALTIADEDALALLRYNIGSFLLRELSQKEIERNIFMVLGFLDRDMAKTSQNNSYFIMLAEMNLTASKRATAGAAFDNAAHYLTRGIGLLPDDHWKSQYDLSLQLFSAAAEAHYCTGALKEAKEYCNEVIEQADRPMLDKERAYTVLLESINAEDNSVLAQEKCTEVLALLGCHFPKHFKFLKTINGMLKASKAKVTLEEELLSMPATTDPTACWIMRFLDRMAVYTFQNKSDLLPLVIFKALNYMKKDGLSDYAAPLLCTMGILLAAGMGDTRGAHQMAEFALSLFDSKKVRIGSTTKARVLFVGGCFGLHFHEPHIRVKQILLEGYETGLRTGDVESAMWAIDGYLETCFFLHTPLQTLEKDCRAYSEQMKDLKQDKIHLHCCAFWQLIQNLLGMSKDPTELSGEAFDFDTISPTLDGFNKATVDRLRITTAFWSGDFNKTVQLLEETGANKGYFDEAFASNILLTAIHCQCALACLYVYRETKKAKYLRLSKVHVKHIQSMANNGNPNVQSIHKLIQAEMESHKRNSYEKTTKLYKEAITLAGRMGIYQEQALANERLADFYKIHRMDSDARYHLQEACKLFRTWGSPHRGFDCLHRKYRDLLGTNPEIPSFLDESASLVGRKLSTREGLQIDIDSICEVPPIDSIPEQLKLIR